MKTTTNMKVLTCGHCGTKIVSYPNQVLYRTCDAYVCNKACQRARLCAIAKLDPRMENPLSWTYDLSSRSCEPIKRKSSSVGLQDLELGDNVTTEVIAPRAPKERDDQDIVTVTFQVADQHYLPTQPPNHPYEYVILCFAFVGSAVMLLSL